MTSNSIHDDLPADGSGDSKLVPAQPAAAEVLQVYASGPVTVIGFGGIDVPDEVSIAAYREQLLQLVKNTGCHTLAIDLTGVKLIPSGMLGVLVTLKKEVEQIELYNASEDIRDVLRITNLQSMFVLKELPDDPLLT